MKSATVLIIYGLLCAVAGGALFYVTHPQCVPANVNGHQYRACIVHSPEDDYLVLEEP